MGSPLQSPIRLVLSKSPDSHPAFPRSSRLLPCETQFWKKAARVSVTGEKNICYYDWKLFTTQDKIETYSHFPSTSNTTGTLSSLIYSHPCAPWKILPSNHLGLALLSRWGRKAAPVHLSFKYIHIYRSFCSGFKCHE